MNTRSRLATTVHSGAMGPKLPPYAAEVGSTPRRVARLARTARRWVYAAAPVVLEAAFYHAVPRGGEAGAFLPNAEETEHADYSLSGEEQRRKQALLDCFVTQRETLSGFPLEYEHFRVAPQYDFQRPPHEGQVLYDQHPWGMTSERFRTLAAAADEELAQWQ